MFTNPLGLTYFRDQQGEEFTAYRKGSDILREQRSLQALKKDQIERAAELFKQASRGQGEMALYASFNRIYCLRKLKEQNAKGLKLFKTLQDTPNLP